MNKRYLPAIAGLLIAITCMSILPVFATMPTFIYAAPTLTVVTIPQDDQVLKTGVMWLADNKADFGTGKGASLVSEYKILVSYNGVPIVPSSMYCQFVEKDKSEVLKLPQGPWEVLKSVPKDMSSLFICKPRWGKPGVGVLDVYYIGIGTAASIADYVLVVGVDYAVARSTVYGTEIQDLCILGWPVALDGVATSSGTVFLPNTGVNEPKPLYTNPLGGWRSCEDLALAQKNSLGVPIQWD